MSLGQHNQGQFPFEPTGDTGGETAGVTLKDYIRALSTPERLALESHDRVNHPPHYTQGEIECIDAIAAATVTKAGIEAVCVANVIKYLWRYEDKGKPVQDVLKARWYLNRLLDVLEKNCE